MVRFGEMSCRQTVLLFYHLDVIQVGEYTAVNVCVVGIGEEAHTRN